MNMKYDIIVIGTGSGGLTKASRTVLNGTKHYRLKKLKLYLSLTN